ncbi:unnamed protein product [Pylaiella littoralis]
MVPAGAKAGPSGVATTQPSPTVLGVVRRMLKQSVHVDLDHDEVTWPPLPAAIAASPTEPKKGQEGETPGSPGFGSEGEGAGATGGAGEAEGGGGVGPPPVWPEEAARRARRVVQSIMFPEFDSFDVVCDNPPGGDFEDDSVLFKCSGVSGGGAEASLRDKIEASRSSAAASGLGRGGGGTAAAGTLTESVVGMYVPTPADLALRAAAAGLVASVLGRVKEFTTLFAQAGLMRFDTSGFVTAVASRNSSKYPASAGINHPNNSNLLSGGGGGSSGGGGADGGGGGTAAAAAAHGSASSSHPGVSDGVASSFGGAGNAAGSAMTEEESASVVVGAGGDDGSSAAGGGGEGSHVWGVPGTEMCLELVRTRAFAALLSDEVFSDVDLETVQAELRAHSREIRKSAPH